MARGSLVDNIRWVFHITGVAWLTPLVGKQDAADLQYLRSAILRDLHWVRSFLYRTDASDQLRQVAVDLAALDGQADPNTESKYSKIEYSWHVPSGWTDYGAIRLQMLAALPPDAWAAALAELGSMAGVVLAGNRARWQAHVEDLERRVDDAVSKKDPAFPQLLQALWREVDFGRNYWRVRVAKNTTITAITWALIVAALLAWLTRAPTDPDVNVWLVALLGLLGGSISALRSTRMISMPERRPIEVEAVRLRLRPVVGAAMGVMLYVIGKSGLVFDLLTTPAATTVAAAAKPEHHAPIQIHVPTLEWGYYALAFVAGFSERWFLRVLELAEAVVPPSRPTSMNPGGSSAGGTGGGAKDVAAGGGPGASSDATKTAAGGVKTAGADDDATKKR